MDFLKRITVLVTILVMLPLLYSCESLLEENPDSFVSTNNFYKSGSDAEAAINAAYEPLGVFTGTDFWVITDMSTDDMDAIFRSNIRVEILEYSFDATHPSFQGVWSDLYDGINRTNLVVNRVANIENMDAGLKERIIGEAKFLRALYYFNAVRLWGGVPMSLTPTEELANLEVERTPADAVYQQIISDLQDAEGVLPTTYSAEDKGRATQGAAKALLAEVHLTREEWSEAANKAQEVIDLGIYDLWDVYKEAFTLENENGKEDIFSVQANADLGEGSNMVPFFTPEAFPNPDGVPVGWGSIKSTEDLYNSYENSDERRDVFITSYTTPDGENVTLPYVGIWKYVDPTLPSTGSSDNNWPILRYSDVLLIYAEAVNEMSGPTNEAYNAINEIRERANLSDLPTGLSQDEFRAWVYAERRRELPIEGERRFDLVRTGRLLETMKNYGTSNIQEHHRLYPIPQNEIILNPKLEQNPGYGN
ncbi:RagB/SusD family nutrient uptake outer membrane protein [Aliifodinibius sp. S!AR15-10]|uniref:RagB/SusD family nutrient uptake outer membrane protein n=1 Tax=Aliifodinibius sp. S!AR15-10 TaxID=2950437 RepID=UPI0028595A9F|nr:RagB/SusD family nutrient uptake outer membrane protein [Aliifodinibius sp. S!AR15-10]MDR8391059.1 RagB/SusD family nutrient uptake outer membrane protein [Aliifodinibius sp. S!AR15-10]